MILWNDETAGRADEWTCAVKSALKLVNCSRDLTKADVITPSLLDVYRDIFKALTLNKS